LRLALEKVSETLSPKQAVVPAIWEVEVGGSRSEAILGKNLRLRLKNKLGAWLK
jgi:hypothetical protein